MAHSHARRVVDGLLTAIDRKRNGQSASESLGAVFKRVAAGVTPSDGLVTRPPSPGPQLPAPHFTYPVGQPDSMSLFQVRLRSGPDLSGKANGILIVYGIDRHFELYVRSIPFELSFPTARRARLRQLDEQPFVYVPPTRWQRTAILQQHRSERCAVDVRQVASNIQRFNKTASVQLV